MTQCNGLLSLTPHRLWEIRGPHLAILLYVVQTENCFNSIAKNWNATRQQWRDGPFHLNIIHLYLGRVDTKHWHFKSGLPFLYRVLAISHCLHKSQRWPLRYFFVCLFVFPIKQQALCVICVCVCVCRRWLALALFSSKVKQVQNT